MSEKNWECPVRHGECEFMDFNTCKITGMKYSFLEFEVECPCIKERDAKIAEDAARSEGKGE